MEGVNTTLSIGTLIHGKYVVEDVLGKGGFGISYLVRNKRDDGKLFVLKGLINLANKERRRITHEAVLLQRLRHAALGHLHRVFNDDAPGLVYILMDYIEGSSLETLRSEQPERKFSFPQVLAFITPIIDAVMYLHNQQPSIIHQNIKPASIIVSERDSGIVPVGYGLAKKYPIDIVRYGSPAYTAPEQYSSAMGTSSRTDIYALGATLYTLLTGTVPPHALSRLAHLHENKPDPLVSMSAITPTVLPTIAKVVHRAMSIDRNDRFSTVEQLWEALWQV